MNEVVQVRLREAGKISYFATGGLKFSIGDYVIIEQDRGLEYGQIVSEPEVVLDTEIEKPLRKIIRKTNPWDHHQIEKNKKKTRELIQACDKKIREHKLPMKLVEAEYSFDRSKIIFYFTAEGRIDFRNLVKELANVFKARIEMKQIGVRDEARLMGGYGPCGKELCCAKFLKDFEPVTIRMAKDQNLPLNPTKISGLCGRLMCCLSYENQTYRELIKGLPQLGQDIKTEKGKGKVIALNPLKRSVTVEIEDGKHIEVKF
ncbi:MAG: stage 0 sporulation family protein [Candidatus Omnitrophica bacterium]|nr:stage 0 sporulation family protein [Candidatus Omnitrophota bacterium]